MTFSLKSLHWVAPYSQNQWRDRDGVLHEIVVGHADDKRGSVFVSHDEASSSSGEGIPVLAPLSGTIVGIDPSALAENTIDIEIHTELEDKTEIINIFRGMTEVPHFGMALGVKVSQGDPIGESNFLHTRLSAALGLEEEWGDLPFWFCFVKRPGEDNGSIVYADDLAREGRGIDWFDDTWKNKIVEQLEATPEVKPAPVNPFPVNPLKPPVKTPSKGGLGKLLLIGSVAWALLAKRK